VLVDKDAIDWQKDQELKKIALIRDLQKRNRLMTMNTNASTRFGGTLNDRDMM
jgi:hypothetical protein